MGATRRVGVGIIGCGNISSQYLRAMRDFPVLEIVAVADMKPEVAARKAAEFGLTAMPVEALLADPRVEIVVNLTIPRAHVEVGLQAIAAGKHVYGEKPLGVNFAEGKRLADAAQGRRAAARLGARHLPRRRPPAGAGADRFGRGGRGGGRHGVLRLPRARALAPRSGLLLRCRRRAGARHGPLLHHRPRQPARPGRKRPGDERHAAEGAADLLRAEKGRADAGEGRDPRGGASPLQVRRHHPGDAQLRRARRTRTCRSSSTARSSACWCPIPTCSAAR